MQPTRKASPCETFAEQKERLLRKMINALIEDNLRQREEQREQIEYWDRKLQAQPWYTKKEN